MAEIVKVNAAELKTHDENRFVPKVVHQSAGLKVVLAYFKKGQFIPVHSPAVELVLCVLEGEAEVVAGDQRFNVAKDDLIIVPKGADRGVKALTDLTVLHVVHPPPSERDHQQVHAGLDAGKFE